MSYSRLEHAGGSVITTLASGIGSGDTTLSLTLSTGWPTGAVGPFYVVVDPGLSTEEKILATARSSSVLSGLTRGVDGTSAAAHSAGATIEHVFVAAEADEANYTVTQTVGKIAAKGDLLIGTAANTIGKLAVPTDGLPLVANSAQSTGWNGAKLAAAGIADATITETLLAASVAGNGLAGGAGTALSVNVDGSTVELSSDQVRVKDLGITLAKFGTNLRPQFICTNAAALTALSSLVEGDQAWVQDTNVRCTYDGAAWKVAGATPFQVAVTGGPTSGTTALTLGTITIPAMPAAYAVEACAMWTGLNSVLSDTFNAKITIDTVTKGSVSNRHTGSVNETLVYPIPTTTLVTIAVNTACVVRFTITRTGGTGTVDEAVAGLMTAKLHFV